MYCLSVPTKQLRIVFRFTKHSRSLGLLFNAFSQDFYEMLVYWHINGVLANHDQLYIKLIVSLTHLLHLYISML